MGSPSPLFYGVICYNRTTVVVPTQVTKKMVSPAAIREKSQRGVALNCDVQVVSAKSVAIRQPCTRSRRNWSRAGTFFSVRHFCAGNSLLPTLARACSLCLSLSFSYTLSLCPSLSPFFLVFLAFFNLFFLSGPNHGMLSLWGLTHSLSHTHTNTRTHAHRLINPRVKIVTQSPSEDTGTCVLQSVAVCCSVLQCVAA